MLMPKKQKHRKSHKGRHRKKGNSTRGISLAFGEYGLKSLEHKWITARQIEAVRRTLTRVFKKKGRIWVRIFPHKPVTAKGAEVPMGKGKGTVDHFVATVRPGMILFEMTGVPEDVAKKSFKSAAHKLPIKTKFITK
ncbi:MAG: 50S ribosomal protein L16 [Patescibacteria group bacterium]|jgi:large subunit ribosomal protein L16|nr:50S ribosomal protein L16 [Patescibacteria group bacterium]MDD5172918.1 50S ribosomal protein L16 [Patescibacteria group bacterium]